MYEIEMGIKIGIEIKEGLKRVQERCREIAEGTY